MNEDRYPFSYLYKRLFDLALFCLAIICLFFATVIGVYSDHYAQTYVVGLSIAVSVIGVFLDHRQKTIYDSDHVEASLLSGSLQAKYLNQIARFRHKVVGANVLLIVAGIIVGGYGAVWGKH